MGPIFGSVLVVLVSLASCSLLSVASYTALLPLYLLTFLGAWFNALTLVTLAWVAAFTLPKLYLNNQSAVDEVVAKVAGQVEEVRAKVVEALPAAMKPPVVKKEE